MKSCAVALAAALGALALAAPAGAQAPELLTRLSASGGVPGEGAGELDNPWAVAASPDKGRTYVVDRLNARISEFTAWGEFVKAWGWGVADGSEELQTCGPAEPEEVPPPNLCQKGLTGSGVGQLPSIPGGITVDNEGAIYLHERSNLRVQKFTPDGEFILMFGGEVNKTKVEEAAPDAQQNVCPVDPTDECQAGKEGADPSYLPSTLGLYIAHSPAEEAIVVGDEDRIQVFDYDGSYREEIAVEGTVNSLDVDDAGNIYFSLVGEEDVFKISPAGEALEPGVPGSSKFKANEPRGVAVDVQGNVYVLENEPVPGEIDPRIAVFKYDSAGNKLLPTPAEEPTKSWFPFSPSSSSFHLNGIATNHCAGSTEPGNLYVAAFDFGDDAYVDAYGTPPIGCEPPPERPPHIVSQYATAVDVDTATLRAEINPRYWDDTAYLVEYGTEPCHEGGCEVAPGSPVDLTDEVTNQILTGAPIALSGLEPGTTYHYRFVAESGFELEETNGPVLGEGGGEAEEAEGGGTTYREIGTEGTFTTFAAPVHEDCPNDDFRTGPGALLPDCRAYERVSPADKAGGDVAIWEDKAAFFARAFEVHRSAPPGNRFTFSSLRAFADPESAPAVSQYLAGRGGGGWSSESISPPRTESPVPPTELLTDNEFQLFSTDLCRAWVRHYSVAPLTEGAIPGYANLYRRENCGATPLHEALSPAEPLNLLPREYTGLRAHGASADGSRSIFVSNDALLEDAPVIGADELLLYEHAPGGLRFVCYLPDETPSPEACAAGTAAGGLGGAIQSSTRNAISADGRVIWWSAFTGGVFPGPEPMVPGTIYARIDGEETIEVSSTVAPDPAVYWTAADDGSKALFSFASGPHEDELYEFDLASEEATQIAGEVLGPMGASEDASRLYLASKEDLDGGGEAGAGANNLYLYEAGGGGFRFVMELASADVLGTTASPSAVEEVPFQREAAVSPDGRYATFSSLVTPPEPFAGLDVNGNPVRQIYRYDSVADELLCVSCNPSGARPAAENIGSGAEPNITAARIQGWEANGHAPRAISNDGSRVFFESIDRLSPLDTNEAWDVYQWEAPGKGTCTEADPSFTEATGGCVELISSGDSPERSVFLDADATGDNVFFSTRSRLIAADTDGLNDVYTARVNGGFPDPPEPPEPCEGEGCRDAAPDPPALPGAATPHLVGPPNPAFKPCARYARRAGALARQAKGLRTRARKAARAAKRSSKPKLTRSLARKARRHAGAAKRRSGAAKRLSSAAKRCRNPQAKSPQASKGARR